MNARGSGKEDRRHDRATFVGGKRGRWLVDRIEGVRGAPLPRVSSVKIIPRWESNPPAGAVWSLRGITEEEHYATPAEQERLRSVQPELGRLGCTRAALIPIQKSRTWWNLPVKVRREIFEERSHHIATGLEYLPAVARRLYHSRSLGEPFDFLTWFEFTPNDSPAFDQLVWQLRETAEWRYVEREVDIRLHRPDSYRGEATESNPDSESTS
jgi:chlorite dismutase